MDKKGLGFLLLAVLLIVSAMVFLPAVQDTAQAQQYDNIDGNVKGWMWSNNIGWIKLDSNETNPVKIVSNQFQGYGWSSSTGWINFAPGSYDGKEPPHGVRIDATGDAPYSISGWARACSVFANDCNGTLKSDSERGGWDGWIKMVNATYDPAENHFEGFAWGYTNLGWTGFSSEIPDDPGCTSGCCNPPCIDGGGEDDVSCSADGDVFAVGAPVTFTALPNKTDYTYVWSGQTGLNNDTTGNPFITQYNEPLTIDDSTNSLTVDITDSSDEPVGTATCKAKTLVNITVCASDGQYAASQEECCPTTPPLIFNGISMKCELESVEPCTLSISPGKGSISYYLNEEFNRKSAKKAEVEISDCGNGISLASTDLNSNFEIVCSSSNSTDPLNYNDCNNLGDDTYYVWVKPLGSLPTDPITRNLFNISVSGQTNSEATKLFRFDYIVVAG